MSTLGPGDGDLHDQHGHHLRSTPAGRTPEVHERRLRLHLEAHAYREYLDGMIEELSENEHGGTGGHG